MALTFQTRFAFFFLHVRTITARRDQGHHSAVIYDDEEEGVLQEGSMMEIRMATTELNVEVQVERCPTVRALFSVPPDSRLSIPMMPFVSPRKWAPYLRILNIPSNFVGTLLYFPLRLSCFSLPR